LQEKPDLCEITEGNSAFIADCRAMSGKWCWLGVVDGESCLIVPNPLQMRDSDAKRSSD